MLSSYQGLNIFVCLLVISLVFSFSFIASLAFFGGNNLWLVLSFGQRFCRTIPFQERW
jgi:hypothetical protein